MIKPSQRLSLFGLSGLAAVITGGVAGYGLLDRRIYQPTTPEQFMPGVVSQDLLSLIVALAVLLCIGLIRRGWQRVWLIWTGLMGYLLYAYALYSFDRVYNFLFLGYVAILGLSVYSLIRFFMCADLGAIGFSSELPPPRRSVAVLLLLLAAMFVSLWLSILIPAMRDRVPPPGNSIFVLDLAFTLPLLVVEAVLLLRKKHWGDVLAIPLLVKMSTLGISVWIGTMIAPWFGRSINWSEVVIYALLGFGPLLFVVRFLKAFTFAPAGKSHEIIA